MKFLSIPTLCMVLCFATSCKKGSDATEISNSGSLKIEASPTTNINNDALLKLVNDMRKAGCTCGTTVMPPVAALTWNANLASAAVYQSNYMFTNKSFAHTSANGATVGDRAKAAGYTWVTVGENIAEGQTTEAQVFNDWIKSESHCKNIMTAGFKEMGAAKSGTYWVQVLGAR